MKTTFVIIYAALVASVIGARGQNLIPTNSDAEADSFVGWDVTTTYEGGNEPTDPLNSASINSDPSFLTQGTYSFHLQDGSSSDSLRFTSATGNLTPFNVSTKYLLSFDAKFLGANPLFQLQICDSPSGGAVISQRVFNLEDASSFSATKSVANGFTEFLLNIDVIFPPNSPPPSNTLYLQLDFWTDFYPNSTSDLYLDNINFTLVPEPNPLLLLVLIIFVWVVRQIVPSVFKQN